MHASATVMHACRSARSETAEDNLHRPMAGDASAAAAKSSAALCDSLFTLLTYSIAKRPRRDAFPPPIMLPSLPLSISFLAVVFMTSCVIASQQPLARPSALPAGSNRVVFIRHAEKGFSPDQLETSVRVNNVSTTGEGIESVKRNDPDGPSTRSFPGSILRDPQTPGGPPRRGGPPGRGRPPGRGGPPGRGPPPDGKFPNGLSEKGKERAQYIRTVSGGLTRTRFADPQALRQ